MASGRSRITKGRVSDYKGAKVVLHMYLYPDILDALKELASLRGVSVSALLEPSIVEFIREQTMPVKRRVEYKEGDVVDWTFDPEIASTICHRLILTNDQGLPRSLLAICDEDKDMPPYHIVCQWISNATDPEASQDEKDFLERLEKTRRMRANMMADWFEAKIGQINANNFRETKVILDFLKYYLERLNSEEWGAPAQQLNFNKNETKSIVLRVVQQKEPEPKMIQAEVTKEGDDTP